MSETSRIPDVEALLTAAMNADADLAALVGGKISWELPSTFPDGRRIRMNRAGGSPVDEDTEYLDRPVVQIEAFGADKGEAFDVAAEAMAAILKLAGRTFPEGVVTKAARLSGPTWAPEPDTGTARYLLSVALIVHAP